MPRLTHPPVYTNARRRSLLQHREHYGVSRRAARLASSPPTVVAVLLAGLGLFGLVARQIPLRRREMGIRLALGARPAELAVSLTQDGLVIGIGALLLGVPLSLITVQALEDTLFQLETTDPLSFGVGCVAVILLYLVASWLPARKVNDMDPAVSLTVQ